jgi:hypothetical protein
MHSHHQVFVRHKNLTTSKAKSNRVKDAKLRRLAPLNPQEVATVYAGLDRYGPRKWSEIVTHLLPHRDASTLCKLFRQATGDPAAGRAPATIRDSLLTTGDAAAASTSVVGIDGVTMSQVRLPSNVQPVPPSLKWLVGLAAYAVPGRVAESGVGKVAHHV